MRQGEGVGTTHQFEVSPFILRSVVLGQATTLSRALAEAVMNSYDAGATEVNIEVTAQTIVIQDDGKGLSSEADVQKYFHVFGFDHDTEEERGRRKFGKFGAGRAQLFAFGVTEWRTGSHRLTVDVDKQGFVYTWESGLPHVPGLTITVIRYDKPLTNFRQAEAGSDQETEVFQREFETQFRYAPLRVRLGAREYGMSLADEAWDHEDDDAYYRVSDRAHSTQVYHQGIYVAGITLSNVGGIIVSKVPLDMNFTRNQPQGKTWDRIRQRFERLGTSHRKNRKKLSSLDKARLVMDLYHKRLHLSEVSHIPLIEVLGCGEVTIERFLEMQKGRTVTIEAASGDLLSDKVSQQGVAVVLSYAMFSRFSETGAQRLGDIRQVLCGIVSALPSTSHTSSPGISLSLRQAEIRVETLNTSRWIDHVSSLRDQVSAVHEYLTDLTPQETCQLRALNKMADHIAAYRFSIARVANVNIQGARTVRLGRSTSAQAWTDGLTYIAVEQRQLKQLSKGFAGFSSLSALLIHEYMHSSSNLGSDVHDLSFYRNFHNVCVQTTVQGTAAALGLCTYVRECVQQGVRVSESLYLAAQGVEPSCFSKSRCKLTTPYDQLVFSPSVRKKNSRQP